MASAGNGTATLYAKLQERYLARDQVGATGVFHELVKAGRPIAEIARETVRVHAPYTHVPYHQRIDRGFVRFVNNDHCLLSTRASLFLPAYVAPELAYMPMAQTVWYVPTALDPWSQLLGEAPGHYGRRAWKGGKTPPFPMPTAHRPDDEPLHLDGPYEDRLDHWLTLVQQGEVREAYRVFLGLFEERERRRDLFAQLAFAGLIDVQDRMLYNRSYTTGHKSYRARATIQLGTAIGWDDARVPVRIGWLQREVEPMPHFTLFDEDANFVSAPVIARERGIRILESSEEDAHSWQSLVNSATEGARNLRVTLVRWSLTVRSLMPSSAAICLFIWPRITCRSTCCSRSVKVAKRDRSSRRRDRFRRSTSSRSKARSSNTSRCKTGRRTFLIL